MPRMCFSGRMTFEHCSMRSMRRSLRRADCSWGIQVEKANTVFGLRLGRNLATGCPETSQKLCPDCEAV